MRAYLDHNATAPLRPEARDAMVAAMEVIGNPSSVHAEGRAARRLIETARAQVAGLAGCDAADVIFTSGATEAAALAIPPGASLSAAMIEHDAVLAWRSGDTVPLPVGRDGRLVKGLAERVTGDVVALQAANSETGVLQETLRHAQQLWALPRPVLVLVDAVQALGKIDYRFDRSGADLMLVSGHKFGGPKGVGALIVKRGIEVAARIPGGGQEMGRRSGTENLIGIAGFGAAAEAAGRDVAAGRWEEVALLRDLLEEALEAGAKATILVGKEGPRLPNTTCIVTPGWKGETQVMQMDLAGFAISAGSACSSGKLRVSAVLKAMGFDDIEASSAIRVSLGLGTTRDEVLRFAESWHAKRRKFDERAA